MPAAGAEAENEPSGLTINVRPLAAIGPAVSGTPFNVATVSGDPLGLTSLSRMPGGLILSWCAFVAVKVSGLRTGRPASVQPAACTVASHSAMVAVYGVAVLPLTAKVNEPAHVAGAAGGV